MARQDNTLAGVSQRPLSRQMTSVTCKYIACFLLALVDDISGRTTGSVGIATMQSKLRPATSLQYSNAFIALTLLVGCQEEHPVCKNYLSGTRCRLFAYGLADATASQTSSSLVYVPFDRRTPLMRVCCCVPSEQEISADCCPALSSSCAAARRAAANGGSATLSVDAGG